MNDQLPNGLSARPPTADDAAAVNDLIRLCDTADFGEPDYTLDDVLSDWRRSGFQLERDAWLVLAPDGTFVAYGNAYDTGENVRVDPTSCIHPDYRTLGLEDYHIARAQEWTRAYADHPVVQWIVLDTHHGWTDRFKARGYHTTRHDYIMEIGFDQAPPAPTIPEGFVLRAFERGRDEMAVWAAIQESFRDHRGHTDMAYDEWMGAYLNHTDWSPELCVVVTDHD